MKKLCLLISLLVVVQFYCEAQYVTLPSSSLTTVIRFRFPACFNGSGQMDTTCTEIITEDSVVFDDSFSGTLPPDILDLSVLQYFDNLKYVEIRTRQDLGYCPPLPQSLETFICKNLIMTSSHTAIPLGSMPAGLKHLDIENCRAKFTNPVWPAGLKYLNISKNMFTDLGTLPSGLDTLNCSLQQFQDFWYETNPVNPYPVLRSLPTLPPTLRYLDCGKNILDSLPQLPAGLTYLDCNMGSVYVTRPVWPFMPLLPGTLEYLDCAFVRIYSLPPLPPALKYLNCSGDSIAVIPPLPAGLIHFRLEGNEVVTTLPELPSTLLYLNVNFCDNLYCLPHLPNSMSGYSPYPIMNNADTCSLVIGFAPINCLPNEVPGIRVFSGRPLCTVFNNLYGCIAAPRIMGHVFYDNNSNGVQDPGELPKSNMAFYPTFGYNGYSDMNGDYLIRTDTGHINVAVGSIPNYNAVPSSFSYNFTTYDTSVNNLVSLQPNTIIDSMKVTINSLNAPRPGFGISYRVKYENVGTTTVNPHIAVNYDNSKLTFTGSTGASVTNNGNSLTVDFTNVVPGQTGEFTCNFIVSTLVPLGSLIHTSASATVGTNTSTDSISSIVIGSFDPNDKQATPSLTAQQVADGNYINYLIRFQNTGTASAINIIIGDTLNSMLQENTFEMIEASHPCKTSRDGNKLFFEFLDINLPDSNTNEPGSHGFIRFRVKPQGALPVNTIIPNRASIYFDFNFPVATGDALTTVNLTLVPLDLLDFSGTVQPGNKVLVKWNTANEINTSVFEIEQGMDGRRFTKVASVAARGNGDNSYAKSLQLPSGIVYYRLKMVDVDGRFTYSNIIKISGDKNKAGFILLNNPVNNELNINVTDNSLVNTKATLISAEGRVVKTLVLKAGVQVVDLSGLSNGNYFIRTINGTEKFVIVW